MTYPPVDVVDDNDNVVGSAMLAKVWDKGLCHRLVFVVVEDDAGRILLQKRSRDMAVFPGCWDISASGHVDSGMSYEEIAKLELEEEAPVPDPTLKEVDYYFASDRYPDGKMANRFIKVFYVRSNHKPEDFNSHEVSELRWFTKDEVADLIQQHPEQVAAGLHKTYLRMWKQPAVA